MTTTPVINTGELMPAQGGKPTAVITDTKSFSDVFKQSTADNAGQMGKTESLPVSNGTESTMSGRRTERSEADIQSRQSAKAKNQTAKTKKDNAAGDAQKTSDAALTPEEEEKAMEILAGAAATVIDQLAELFQITPEEVSDTMEMLGMSETDLFDTAGFQNLFATLAQDPESSFLLTGGELADSFEELWGQISQTLEETGTQNGWSTQQLQNLWKESDNLPAEELLAATEEMNPEETAKDTSYTVTFLQDGKEVTYDVTRNGDNGVAATEGMTETEIPKAADLTDSQKESGHHKENLEQTEKGAELVQEFQSNPMNVNGDSVFTESLSSFSQVDTQSIMDQIMDYMKVDNSEAFTKLEMQLHPETMGRVVIEITSRNGELTAQITTQNEAVRAALESQIVSLKENLNEQGLRVENVQVTVESHAFEQSYEGQGQNENKDTFANRPKTHRIHLDDLNLEDEELTDEERMVAELMADRGGTLDYTV